MQVLIFIYLSINRKWFVNYEKEKKKDKGENNYCDSNADDCYRDLRTLGRAYCLRN